MIEFAGFLPLTILVIFLAVYSVKAIFIVYHLLKFGLDYKTKIIAIVFSSGSALIMFFNYYLFSKIRWEQIYRYFDISIL